MPTSGPNYAALRAALARERAARRMTYEALAEASGLSRTSVINLETGRYVGSLGSWYAIARALNVPVTELLKHLDH